MWSTTTTTTTTATTTTTTTTATLPEKGFRELAITRLRNQFCDRPIL